MSGMGKSFKKKMALRSYREREQPSWRKDKGFLEKKVDYQKRAKAFNTKKATLSKLRERAELKNDQEFYFKMKNSRINVR